MDEGRKRVLAIVAGILVARHLSTANDLFGGPQGSPRTDAMIAAAVQWAERIMRKIDSVGESTCLLHNQNTPQVLSQKLPNEVYVIRGGKCS